MFFIDYSICYKIQIIQYNNIMIMKIIRKTEHRTY